MSYKLRSTLSGHEADVRCVAPAIFPEGGILTVSRDTSCRVWTPEESAPNKFQGTHIFYGHTRYVASVCMMQPSEAYPFGLVVTGGHDNLILVFDFSSLEPIQRLEGHTSTVCSLDAGKSGTILSGSWDNSAKVWINGKSVMTLSDHEAAVWSVKTIPDKGLMLTASADKTIKLWKAGKCERTYIGHTDCVRGLALLPGNEFLSCSNDGSIRKWTLNGDCLEIYEGHSSFVYSVAVIPNSDGWFVSSGEDRSVRIWKDGLCAQTIILPCVSVWSVDVLQNGDIIVGSSDGFGRVFTCNENRQASQEKIKEFEESVSNQAIPTASSLDLGAIKVDQLPGPEALLRPGTGKDQTKLVKRNGIVEAHQWDDVAGCWQKVGEVTGAAGEDGSKRSSKKQVYEGKECDYVFDVDIEEGKPPLKLPFNISEDPWSAAQSFLERNNLSQLFLDQVAKFIIKNTKSITLGASPSDISDPFTGAGRYIPQSNETSSGNTSANSSTVGVDPFTGTGQYMPNSDAGAATQYFPEKIYIKFSSGKSDQIISKMKEFNVDLSEDIKLTSEEVQAVSDVASAILQTSNCIVNKPTCQFIANCLKKLASWPPEKLIPVLDLLRIFVMNETLSNEYIYDGTHAEEFLENLLNVIRSVQPVAHIMLAYRILTNSFSRGRAAEIIYANKEKILDCCETSFNFKNKNLSIAVSSCIVNHCVYFRISKLGFEDGVQLCTYIIQYLSVTEESEAVFRLLVSLGTLLSDNPDLVAFSQSLDIGNTLKLILGKDNVEKLEEYLHGGIKSRKVAENALLVYLHLIEVQNWFDVESVIVSLHQFILLKGRRNEKMAIEYIMPVTSDYMFDSDQIEKCIDIASEYGCKKEELLLAFADETSSIVFYKISKGLVPPNKPSNKEMQKRNHIPEWCEQNKQWEF